MLQNLLIDRLRLAYHFEKKQMDVYEVTIGAGGVKMKESPPNAPEVPSSLSSVNGMSRWTGNQTAMKEIIERLTGELGGPVVDATGLKGKYDFSLSWRERNDAPADVDGPTIAEAIQQLGLKVQRKKGLVEVFVIDHVDKSPRDN